MKKAKVFILYTGGTIGMAPKDENNPSSPLEPKKLEELMQYITGLEHLPITFGEASFEKPLDSSDVKPKHWLQMANEIEKVYDEYDGFIILHGTDTMAYTSSGLSFIFENLSKPIVVTGSQLPISDTRTDAVMNFINSIYIAGYKAFNLPLVPEVMICFADKILRGCRATKVSSTQWAGFDSPNFPPLGSVGEHITINTEIINAPSQKKLIVNKNLEENIISFPITPGLKAEQLEELFKHFDGIVLNTFGAGNAPGDEDFLEVIADTIKQDKVILNITQCVQGMVEMGLYEASSTLLERGVVSGLDMTNEAAMAKLMWTLETQFGDGKVTQLQINQRGEQSENLFDLRYGDIKKSSAKNIYTQSSQVDGRLNRDRLSKAVIRLSDFDIIGAKENEEVEINIFINMPRANKDTSKNEDRCVHTFTFNYTEESIVLIQDITDRAKHVLGDGDIIVSVVSPNPNIKFYFKGLYLALFSKA